MIICRYCKIPTVTISPIILKRFTSERFHVSGLCSICLNSKAKFLNTRETPMLPDFVYNLRIPSTNLEYIDDNNGKKTQLKFLLEKIINV